MTLLEPTTTLTDYALGILALVLGLRLWAAARREGQTSVRLWSLSFFSVTIAALAGGTSHGFAGVLSPLAHTVLWKTTVWSIGLTAALLLAAVAWSSLRGRTRSLLVAVAVIQFGIYALWMLRHDDFIYVIADYLPAVLVVLALQTAAWRRGTPGAGMLALGVVTTLIGAAIQASGFTIHRHFNHNDLYHVVQMAATVMLYQGALLARDRPAVTTP